MEYLAKEVVNIPEAPGEETANIYKMTRAIIEALGAGILFIGISLCFKLDLFISFLPE